MATRKTPKIDPVQIYSLALKQVKSVGDYYRLRMSEPARFQAAWNQLPESEQQRLTDIVRNAVEPSSKEIADELSACGTLIQLQATKSSYGAPAIKAAWKLLPQAERDRLTAVCKHQDIDKDGTPNMTDEEPEPVIEQPTTKRTLFSISDDLQNLNDLLDEVGDDAQQQELIAQWFETLGEERDRKLDGYAALISEMQARAEVRKAEARRLQELAATDENRARLLKERLKSFFQLHDIKTIDTARYRLSLAKNGGKAPLILDESVPVTQLPEQFQKVSIDADTAAIRAALEAGESLEWARLGERGTSMRIK